MIVVVVVDGTTVVVVVDGRVVDEVVDNGTTVVDVVEDVVVADVSVKTPNRASCPVERQLTSVMYFPSGDTSSGLFGAMNG